MVVESWEHKNYPIQLLSSPIILVRSEGKYKWLNINAVIGSAPNMCSLHEVHGLVCIST